MVDFVSELWAFLSERKKLWLAPMLAVILVIGALLIWRHRLNLQKLIKGTEGKIGQRAGQPAAHTPAKNTHKQGIKS